MSENERIARLETRMDNLEKLLEKLEPKLEEIDRTLFASTTAHTEHLDQISAKIEEWSDSIKAFKGRAWQMAFWILGVILAAVILLQLGLK